jgi:chaperone modulatory protein CbpM
MITIEVLISDSAGLRRQDLERWIANDWVRPDRQGESFLFREIDVARIQLIRELRDEMEVNEEALPVVLSLLDQVYDLRRRMRQLGEALSETAPEDVRERVANHLKGRSHSPQKVPLPKT